MKKTQYLSIGWIIVLIMLLNTAFAQKLSYIQGKADLRKVFLYKIDRGNLEEMATAVPNISNQFAISFIPEYDGLYALGAAKNNSLAGIFLFYFKAGEQLNVELNGMDYKLTGKNTDQNLKIKDWYTLTLPLLQKAVYRKVTSTFVDYFPQVEELKKSVEGLKNSLKTNDPVFKNLYPKLLDYDLAYLAVGYLYTPRSAHPAKEELSAYYKELNPDKFLNKDLFLFPYADRLMGNLLFRKVNMAAKPTFDDLLAAIPDNELQGEYVVGHLSGKRSYADYLLDLEKYKPYLVHARQQEQVAKIALALADTKEGTPAVNFSYPDINGKKTALADLKGKVVLVDLWATWCGPCKAEEPHWEKLNEVYAGKNVAFVGISLDQNKSLWDKYVPEKKLKGIQLHAGPQDDLSKAYKVKGIPRYILIDKKGNLITPDSPRPSDPNLKLLIDQALTR